jgi:hypothetical protein
MIIRELIAKLGLDVDEVAFAKGEAAIKGLQKGFVAFAAAAVAGLAVAAAALVKGTADAGDSARKLSQSTGLGVEQFQQFAYAAGLADVSTEELAQALRRLAKTGVRDVGAEVLKLAERFKEMPDDGAKVALAMEKFGRAGAKLIPLLNGGREEISKLMAEAQEMGVVFSEEDAAASEEFNDQLTRLQSALLGLRNAIGKSLLPVFYKLAKALTEFLKSLQRLPKFVQENIQWFKALGIVLGSVLLAAVIANIGAIWGLVAGYAAAGAAAVASAAMAAAAWVVANLPLIAMAAAIAFVLLVLEDLYQFLTGGESVIGDFVDYVEKEFGGWRGFFQSLMDWIKHLIEWDWIAERATEAWEKVKQVFANGWKWVVDHTPDVVKKGINLAGEGVDVIANVMGGGPGAVFGGGASPDASVSSTVNTPAASQVKMSAPQFSSSVTVNASTNANPGEIANQVVQKQEDFWQSQMSTANGGVD